VIVKRIEITVQDEEGQKDTFASEFPDYDDMGDGGPMEVSWALASLLADMVRHINTPVKFLLDFIHDYDEMVFDGVDERKKFHREIQKCIDDFNRIMKETGQ